MSELENGFIPTKLDTPPKILLWELDVAIVFAVPIWFFGFILKQALLAILMAFLLSYIFKRVKTSTHPKFLKHLMYWYMPPGMLGIKLKSVPKSFVRVFLS